LLLPLLFAGGVQAQQVDFKRVSRSGDELLAYRWVDADKREHLTSFTLTRDAIKEAEESFREFSLAAMWRYLEVDLRNEVEKFGQGTHLNLSRTKDGLHWTIQAPDQKTADLAMQKTKTRLAQDEKTYLTQHLRHRVDDRRIMVDYAAATSALTQPMKAVARALGETPGIEDDDRARINLALGFMQEIPYAVLEDKERRGGDFLPAPAMLAQNRGDCDSKAVTLAAILKTYARSRRMAMVTMPEHAILAVEIPAKQGDWTVQSQGRQYVALEAAGPAMAPIGRVGLRTGKYLQEGREIEIWPLN